MVDDPGIAGQVAHEPHDEEVTGRCKGEENPPSGQPGGRHHQGHNEGEYTQDQAWEERHPPVGGGVMGSLHHAYGVSIFQCTPMPTTAREAPPIRRNPVAWMASCKNVPARIAAMTTDTVPQPGFPSRTEKTDSWVPSGRAGPWARPRPRRCPPPGCSPWESIRFDRSGSPPSDADLARSVLRDGRASPHVGAVHRSPSPTLSEQVLGEPRGSAAPRATDIQRAWGAAECAKVMAGLELLAASQAVRFSALAPDPSLQFLGSSNGRAKSGYHFPYLGHLLP